MWPLCCHSYCHCCHSCPQVSIGPRSYSILLTERAHAALDLAGADLSAFDAPELGIAMRHKWVVAPKSRSLLQYLADSCYSHKGVHGMRMWPAGAMWHLSSCVALACQVVSLCVARHMHVGMLGA